MKDGAACGRCPAERPLVRALQQTMQGLRSVHADMRPAITKMLEQELRLIVLFGEPRADLPLPNDIEAERRVASALLYGVVRPGDLDPLSVDHYFNDFHAAVHTVISRLWASGAVADDALSRKALRRVVRTIMSEEMAFGSYSDHALTLLEQMPYTLPQRLTRDDVPSIIETAAARDLVNRLVRLDAKLRARAITVAEAYVELSTAISAGSAVTP